MSDRLKLAFEEASKLSELEQEEFAEFLLAELADEQQWKALFARSADQLSKLAAQARREHRAGKTQPLGDLLR